MIYLYAYAIGVAVFPWWLNQVDLEGSSPAHQNVVAAIAWPLTLTIVVVLSVLESFRN